MQTAYTSISLPSAALATPRERHTGTYLRVAAGAGYPFPCIYYLFPHGTLLRRSPCAASFSSIKPSHLLRLDIGWASFIQRSGAFTHSIVDTFCLAIGCARRARL